MQDVLEVRDANKILLRNIARNIKLMRVKLCGKIILKWILNN
jgi:hypothetical protein